MDPGEYVAIVTDESSGSATFAKGVSKEGRKMETQNVQ